MGLRSIISILLLPGTMTVVVPFLILSAAHPRGWEQCWIIPLLAGAAVICAGLVLVGWTVGLFATVGRGTLAPWDPPRHLVVDGPYRHGRNPMISGILFILAGETVMFMSAGLLIWATAFFTVSALFIPFFEEPALERRFGDQYTEYKRNVPRWIPRWKAWQRGGNE